MDSKIRSLIRITDEKISLMKRYYDTTKIMAEQCRSGKYEGIISLLIQRDVLMKKIDTLDDKEISVSEGLRSLSEDLLQQVNNRKNRLKRIIEEIISIEDNIKESIKEKRDELKKSLLSFHSSRRAVKGYLGPVNKSSRYLDLRR